MVNISTEELGLLGKVLAAGGLLTVLVSGTIMLIREKNRQNHSESMADKGYTVTYNDNLRAKGYRSSRSAGVRRQDESPPQQDPPASGSEVISMQEYRKGRQKRHKQRRTGRSPNDAGPVSGGPDP